MDQLQAQTFQDAEMRPPIWLAEPTHPWKPEAVVLARNGLFHLPSLAAGDGTCLVPTPALFTLSPLDYDISLDAPKPERFLGFLGELWPGDRDSINCLQEWFGYALTSDTSLQKILLIVGPTRSGKGTLTRVLNQLVGPRNVASPTLNDLGHGFGLQGLMDKQLAIIHDARLGGRADKSLITERLLSISGEDSLDIHRKYLPPLSSIRLPTRIMMTTNELPRLTDVSGALARRLVILQLTESFYGKEDPMLTDKLLEELPGIFLWAVEGWKRLNGREPKQLTIPESSADAMQEMDELGSPIRAFVDECCELAGASGDQETYSILVAELFGAFRNWAGLRGLQFRHDQAGFGRDLKTVMPGLVRRRSGGPGRPYMYDGIRLAPDSQSLLSSGASLGDLRG